MKVILLTQYFPPETGAPQNRLFALARAMHANGAEVTVLTAMPNYPDMRVHEEYRRKWKVKERMEGFAVIRAWLFVSPKRGFFHRLCNYFSFVCSSLLVGLFSLRRSDVLFVESPPLFLGITAMVLAKAKGAKLVFNVSDLWPESAVQLGLVKNKTMIAASTWLEERCYRTAALITGQTQGIVRNIQDRFPSKRVAWIPNGVDFPALVHSEGSDPQEARARYGALPGDLVLAYAGIIGHAQGLEVVLNAAAVLHDRAGIRFLLIGDGPEKERLQRLASGLHLRNLVFVDRMPRNQLLGLLRGVDAVVVPLRRNDLFKGAIPSKVFEALALSKPLLLGVEGEAKELFIDTGHAGIAVVPEDHNDLARAVLTYNAHRELLGEHGANGRAYAQEHFDRAVIDQRLINELVTLVSGPH